jgi:hypothetical protein
MRSTTIMLAFVLVVFLGWVEAQAGPPASTPVAPFAPTNAQPCPAIAGCDTPLMKQFDLYHDMPFKLLARDREAKKWDKEFALKESVKLIQSMSIPCEPVEAEQAGGGKVEIQGRMLQVSVYEAGCKSGTGYFLVSQPPQQPVAISCFAAEAARAADLAKGVAPDGFTCELSGRRDTRLMASSVLKGAGTPCDVNDYRWVGVSYKTGMEFSEVACAGGQGYVIEVPRTSVAEQLAIVGCQDAVQQGILCSLTSVTKPVTLQTLREAIKEHGVECEPAQTRYVGREGQGRRYVVEMQCPQQPKGLVAFIPVGDNTKPFETVDCATAATRSAVQCELTAKQ